MSHNSFGHLFRVTTWGESHGPAIGCVVDGCPPGLALSEADIQPWLDRRRPGTSRFVTQRREPDAVRVLSGVYEGRTTGTPIALAIENLDQRSRDYAEVAGEKTIELPRALDALDRLGLDSAGLDDRDKKYLETLIHRFAGGPVGVDTLATAISEDALTLEEAIRLVDAKAAASGGRKPARGKAAPKAEAKKAASKKPAAKKAAAKPSKDAAE